MKTLRILFLAALALSFGACARSPRFNVRLVDSASGAPIGGAEVDCYTDSGRWTTSRESNTYLGETDGRGMFSVDRLNMNWTHRVTFYKAGYLTMFVFVGNLDEEDVCWITDGFPGKDGESTQSAIIPLADSPTVEVRMTRGREMRRRTPHFAPTTGPWWKHEEGR